MISSGRGEDGSERAGGGRGDGAVIVPRVVERVRRADDQLVAAVRERPIAALCAAAVLGYVIGRVVTRLG